jgi:hypothetical protein
VAGSYEHGNELSSFIIGAELLNWRTSLFKKDALPWDHFTKYGLAKELG